MKEQFRKPMPRLVLHIGMHKTGTSSIQALLASIQEDLRSEGILYPMRGRHQGGHAHHLLLPPSVSGENGAGERCWLEVLEEVRCVQPQTVVLSSETLDLCSADQVRLIREYLQGFSVDVVIYLRNQLAWTISGYKENVKQGVYDRSFRQFIEDQIDRCNYGDILRRWTDAFGKGHVLVRLYDKAKATPGIEHDFMGIIGINSERYAHRISNLTRENVSLADDVIKALRVCNSLQKHLQPHPRAASVIRHISRSVLDRGKVGRVLLACCRTLGRGTVCQDKDVAWLRDAVKEWNLDFLKTYVSPEDHALFDF